MTQEQIIDGNKLIAEFMGATPRKHNKSWWTGFKEYPHDIHISSIEYHTSWDWLMPVVEKIESLSWIIVRISRTTAIYKVDIQPSLLIGDGNKISGTLCKIENTYTAVVQFIKWHNQQPK